MAETRERCVCGGTRIQHQGDDEGCWCRRCLDGLGAERCREWRTAKRSLPPVDRAVAPVRHDAPDTTELAARIARLRAGSRRKETYEAIRLRGALGLTDDELEGITGRSHQALSATRNSLMVDGLLVDSGQRRSTRYGNQAIVWVVPGALPTNTLRSNY